ncbi:MAG: transcriptional repressor LexA [Pseudomonadota bacterium]|nr:transcriptional repressor LexA [Pseudomonadota bacterium]
MLTLAQRKTYDIISDYFHEQGYSPTLDEIAQRRGITSRGTVHRDVQALVTEGLIRIVPNRKRSIELCEAANERRFLPLLGKIAAGRPIEAIPDQRTVDIANIFLKDNHYALQVEGDSMIEEGIFDGDVVVCKQAVTADDGQIVVALVDQCEATLKRLRRNADRSVTLVPANPHLHPMTYAADRVQVQGVYIGLLRFLTP